MCMDEDTIRAQEVHPVREELPYVVSWPKDASHAFYQEVHSRYFSAAEERSVDWFNYCILIHKADSPYAAIHALQKDGAFATQLRRNALIAIVEEAKNSQWCLKEVLSSVERYARYAFVLDGLDITCGSLPCLP